MWIPTQIPSRDIQICFKTSLQWSLVILSSADFFVGKKHPLVRVETFFVNQDYRLQSTDLFEIWTFLKSLSQISNKRLKSKFYKLKLQWWFNVTKAIEIRFGEYKGHVEFFFKVMFRPRVNFTNISHTVSTRADLKSAKNTVKLSVFFSLLGSVRAKAACKTLMKLTPNANFRTKFPHYFC